MELFNFYQVIIEPTDRCVRTEIGEMVEGDSMICAYAKHADACQVFVICELNTPELCVASLQI